MGFFKKKEEIRADTQEVARNETDEALITALLGHDTISKEEALSLPDVQYCLELIGGTIAGLPIRLYDRGTGEEITDDPRTRLLNRDTGDTLTATQFWKAMIEDYYFGDSGGYAYINKRGSHYKSLNYLDGNRSFTKNVDPIFKDYTVYVQGKTYYPHDFLKILRKTKDGMRNITMLEEANLILSVAYYCYRYQDQLVRSGGNKRGFLKSEKKLEQKQLTALKEAFRRLYANNTENVVVLNAGLDFKEATNTSLEMQMIESIQNNSSAVRSLFGLETSKPTESSTDRDDKSFTRCITRVIQDIEASINRDMLLEREKDSLYFAFDTRELTRGNIKDRYEAYAIALEHNFLQIDEVREQEDFKPLGIDWLTLGLDKVLYNPKTKECYTPNTKENITLGEKGGADDESGIKS